MAEHCLRSRNCVNVIVAGKQPPPQWIGIVDAVRHCAADAGLWDWAGNHHGLAPEVVMRCAGDGPTMETLGKGGGLHPPYDASPDAECWVEQLEVRVVRG